MKIQINEQSLMRISNANITRNNDIKSINISSEKPLYNVPLKGTNIIYDSNDGMVIKKNNQLDSITEEIEDINIMKK